MADERPIIIKRVKKIAAGNHGGAWKLAYADFVTAMMAFFLLMWLLGSTTEGDKKGIADFFQNPWKPSLSGGRGSGDATSVIDGGGDDVTRSFGQVKKTNSGTQEYLSVTSEESSGSKNSRKSGAAETPSESEKAAAAEADAEAAGAGSEAETLGAGTEAELTAREVINLRKAKEKLQDLISKSEILHPFSDQFQIDITTEGLRIQVVDEDKRPMFDLGSVRMERYATEIMREIAPIIDQLPNRVSVTGHTDGRPYGGGGRGYSNWELSADRANAARRALVVGGVKEGKFLRVVGLADSIQLDPKDALNPINRRISIIVMKRSAEQQLRDNSGPVVEVGKGAAPQSPDITPVLFPPKAPPLTQPITQPIRPGQSTQPVPPTARPTYPLPQPVLPTTRPNTPPAYSLPQPVLPTARSATPLSSATTSVGRTGIR